MSYPDSSTGNFTWVGVAAGAFPDSGAADFSWASAADVIATVDVALAGPVFSVPSVRLSAAPVTSAIFGTPVVRILHSTESIPGAAFGSPGVALVATSLPAGNIPVPARALQATSITSAVFGGALGHFGYRASELGPTAAFGLPQLARFAQSLPSATFGAPNARLGATPVVSTEFGTPVGMQVFGAESLAGAVFAPPTIRPCAVSLTPVRIGVPATRLHAAPVLAGSAFGTPSAGLGRDVFLWRVTTAFGKPQLGFVRRAYLLGSFTATRFGIPMVVQPSQPDYVAFAPARSLAATLFGVPRAPVTQMTQASSLAAARFGEARAVPDQAGVAAGFVPVRFGSPRSGSDQAGQGVSFARSVFGTPASGSDRFAGARSFAASRFGVPTCITRGAFATSITRTRFGQPTVQQSGHIAYSLPRLGRFEQPTGFARTAAYAATSIGGIAAFDEMHRAATRHEALPLFNYPAFGRALLRRPQP